jgi:hypothetical protein
MQTILGVLGRIPRPTPAMGVALLALLIAASGAAVAAIPSTDGTISACRDNRSGALRVIDAASAQTCSSKETQLAWKDGIHGKVADSELLDGKSANDLSRVAVMNTADTTDLRADGQLVTYGSELSITAPADGFVRINGNVTVADSGCSSGCQFQARARHINTGSVSIPQEDEVLDGRGNAGLDAVFPVSAGVNTFDIRLNRFVGDGILYGWWGVLTAEYTPYGSTGGGTLSASGLRDTSQAPINKEPPTP